MQTSAVDGLKLLLPYVVVASIVVAAILALAYRFRGPLSRWTAQLSEDGSASSGAVSLLVLAALTPLTFLGAIEIFAVLGFALGVRVQPATVAVSALATGVVLVFAARRLVPRARVALVSLLLGVGWAVLFALCLMAAGRFYDVSWDGNWYHQQPMVAMAKGWNPLRDHEGATVKIGDWEPKRKPGEIWDVAVNHYSKGEWIRNAALYSLTDRIESAKGTNLVLLLVQFLAWAAVALALKPGRWWRALLLGVLMAANPISAVQAFTYKNDGQLGSLLTIGVGLGCVALAGVGGWPAALGVAFALGMLITIKFTGLVYAVMIAFGLVAIAFLGRRLAERRAMTIALAVTLVVATLGVGFNPYVFNTIDHGNPFYPLMGAHKINIVANQWPTNFSGTTSPQRLFLSLFSKGADESILAPGGDSTHLKVPFTLYKSEIRPYLGFDIRVAGFGPWFSGALVLAFVLLVLLIVDFARRRDRILGAGLLVVALLVATVLVNPESWWARYAPQIWMVPVIIAALGLMRRSSRLATTLAVAVCAVLFVNAMFVETINFSNVIHGRNEVSAALDTIAKWPNGAELQQGDFDVSFVRFQERGIKWRLLGADEKRTGGLVVPYTTVAAYPMR